MQTSGQRMTEQSQPNVQPLGWMSLAALLAPCLLASHLPLGASRSAVAAFSATESPPNVVAILSDDQGWGDGSFSGNRNLQTPHSDSLDLVLQASEIPGDQAIDVHSIVLTRKLDPADIQVMSYNIRYANPNDGEDVWERRAETVFDVVRQPDIVGLQEVTARQWDAIRKATPEFTWYGVGREDGQRGGEFTPIGFRSERFQALDRGTFWLSETPEQVGSRGWDAALPRIASWVMLRDSQTDRRLLVINTHFDHRGPEARFESGKLINQKIPELAKGEPVIVMGDLNAMPDSEPLEALRSGDRMTLHDSRSVSKSDPAGPEGTWNGFERIQNDRRIDHLLVSDGISVERYETLDPKTAEGRFASDHLPVVAEIRLTAPTQ